MREIDGSFSDYKKEDRTVRESEKWKEQDQLRKALNTLEEVVIEKLQKSKLSSQ